MNKCVESRRLIGGQECSRVVHESKQVSFERDLLLLLLLLLIQLNLPNLQHVETYHKESFWFDILSQAGRHRGGNTANSNGLVMGKGVMGILEQL